MARVDRRCHPLATKGESVCSPAKLYKCSRVCTCKTWSTEHNFGVGIRWRAAQAIPFLCQRRRSDYIYSSATVHTTPGPKLARTKTQTPTERRGNKRSVTYKLGRKRQRWYNNRMVENSVCHYNTRSAPTAQQGRQHQQHSKQSGAPAFTPKSHLDSLPPGRDRLAISSLMEDALCRDSHALAFERGVSVTGGLRSSLANLLRRRVYDAMGLCSWWHT